MVPRTVNGEIVDRRFMTLYQEATIGGKTRFHSFEKEVVWVASSETELSFWHGGELLKTGSTYNDFYGYLTSLNYDDGLQHRVAQEFKVDQSSSLEIKLITSLLLTPYLENDECRQWNKDATERRVKIKFLNIPSDYRIPYQDDFGDGPKTYYKTLSDIPVAEQVVWSSCLSHEENSNLLNDFTSAWKPGQASQHFLDAICREITPNIA